jgi:RNA polymerase sigma-70 factor (ECF subfamily)
MSDDVQLVALCKAGSLDAFGELVHRYEGRLFATMCSILYNAEDARDALQDTFLLAYESLDKFEGRSDFYTWLHRIGVNAAITFKRKRQSVSSLDQDGNGQSWEPPDTSHGSEPSHSMVCAEESTMVRKALARLSPRDRALLVLKDIEGLRYAELAVRLRMPLGTVRSRLHRARLKLLRLLSEAR